METTFKRTALRLTKILPHNKKNLAAKKAAFFF